MTATLQSYSTGTVSVSNGSNRVTLAGAGAAWPSSWCVPGNQIVIAGEAQTNYIAAWIDDHTVDLALPVARATAAGLTYSILITAPAFGTNFEAARTNIERIRLTIENAVVAQLVGIASGDLATPALQDRIGLWDASDDMNAKPGTLAAALKAGSGVLAKAASYAVTVDDYGSLIAMSAGTGARTVTLPVAATAGAGFVIGVKKTDASANAVTVAASGADTVDGAASLALTVQYSTVILRCDGAAWHVVVLENTSSFARTLLDDPNAAAMQATLGVAPKQASVTDTTAGAGLIVGAFGIGAQIVSAETDFNKYTVPGVYITPVISTMTNTPPSWAGFTSRAIVIVGGGASYASQIAIHAATSRIAYRAGNGGTLTTAWSDLPPYEEGTWTPTYSPASGAFGSITYASTVGRYIKIGNLVIVSGRIRTSALTVGTASGQLSIAGLPFSATYPFGVTLGYAGGFTNSPIQAGNSSGTTVTLYTRSAANGSSGGMNVSDMNAAATNDIIFSAVYITS